MNLKNFKKLSGDASFRQFFRSNNAVIVFSKKDKTSNLLVYDAINSILLNNNILAPKLIEQEYSKNFIKIEDFGDKNMLHQIQNSRQKVREYQKILKILNKIQKIRNYETKTFLGTKFKLSKYTKKKLLNESYLFLEWYLPCILKNKNNHKIKKKIKKIIQDLYLKLKLKNKVFVHRDFHVSNMMIKNRRIALIDNQDAILGNPAYDLASLIDDVRINTSNKLKSQILNIYTRKLINIDKNEFINDFEILSVLRNLKIIGIFSRLAMRDKKPKYLRLIPYAWKLIEHRLKNNSKFHQLNMVLKKNPKIKNAN
mgnify:FL=1